MRAAGEQASQDSAAGALSPATADKQPATPENAGARGHPRAAPSSAASAAGGRTMDDDTELDVIYSGESDGESDSKWPAKPIREAEGARSTTAPIRGSIDPRLHRELFGSSDESMNSSLGSSRLKSNSFDASGKQDDAIRPDSVDDSSRSHHGRSDRSVHGDTTQVEQDRNLLRSAPENRPWMYFLSQLREWYGLTGSYRIPLFNSSSLHGLDVSARNYRTEHDFTSTSEKDIDGATEITTEASNRWRKRGIRLSPTSRALVVMPGPTDSMQLAISLSRIQLPVLDTNCTGCLERQVYLASRWERSVWVGLTAQFVPLGRPSSLTSRMKGCASSPRCTKGMKICNPFTNAPGVNSTMALHRRRVCLVVLLDENGDIHHQLRAGLPAVPRGWIYPPLDDVTRP